MRYVKVLKEEKYKKRRRWLFAFLVLISALWIYGGDNERSNRENSMSNHNEENIEKDKKMTNIKYEIVMKEDVSYANVKRFVWEVVIEQQVSVEELIQVSKEIIEEAKSNMDFNSLVLFLYDYEEFIGRGYTLGKVEYAPDGDWSKADTIKAGEYDKMDYKLELMYKDWELQLTKNEAKILGDWYDLYDSNVTDEKLPDDNDISAIIAKSNNIDIEVVNNILGKHTTWMLNDNK